LPVVRGVEGRRRNENAGGGGLVSSPPHLEGNKEKKRSYADGGRREQPTGQKNYSVGARIKYKGESVANAGHGFNGISLKKNKGEKGEGGKEMHFNSAPCREKKRAR